MYGGEICFIINAAHIDPVVVNAFFAALQPAQLDVLEADLHEQNATHEQLAQQWRQRQQRTQYEAHLAQRQYDAVDPDNRLVAAALERRWENKLQALATVENEVEQFQQRPTPTTLSAEMRRQFRTICDELPSIWDQLPNQDKKQLLRALIKRVVLTRETSNHVAMRIVWVSGHYSLFDIQVGTCSNNHLPHYDEMVAQIHALWQQGADDVTIAAELTAAGLHSARSDRVSAESVLNIRIEYGWNRENVRDSLSIDNHLSITDTAKRLDVSKWWIYNRIRRGQIPDDFVFRHPDYDRIFIRNEPEIIAALLNLKDNANAE